MPYKRKSQKKHVTKSVGKKRVSKSKKQRGGKLNAFFKLMLDAIECAQEAFRRPKGDFIPLAEKVGDQTRYYLSQPDDSKPILIHGNATVTNKSFDNFSLSETSFSGNVFGMVDRAKKAFFEQTLKLTDNDYTIDEETSRKVFDYLKENSIIIPDTNGVYRPASNYSTLIKPHKDRKSVV